MNHSFT